jgi:hypothetical protein
MRKTENTAPRTKETRRVLLAAGSAMVLVRFLYTFLPPPLPKPYMGPLPSATPPKDAQYGCLRSASGSHANLPIWIPAGTHQNLLRMIAIKERLLTYSSYPRTAYVFSRIPTFPSVSRETRR